MVQSDIEREKVEYAGNDYTQSESQSLGLRREPSFSRWNIEDEIVQSDVQLESADESVEDSDFELPLLQQGGSENGFLDREVYQNSKFRKIMYLNGGNNMDGDHIHVGENVHKQYVPFDIENGSKREASFSSLGVDVSNSPRNREASPPKSQGSFSVADVLKTLFFILVWYTFSLFLTLYNKTLLGDDLGKFPAPLLMNTIHFAMQAGLSKAITWYRSERFQTSVSMSWRDYFTALGSPGMSECILDLNLGIVVISWAFLDCTRWTLTLTVVPTALGTALDINLSNASLVFISVTFATMCKSASPIFLLLFAFAFRLEYPSFKLLGIIFVISIGILLTVAKETEFDFWGFIFVMLAAVMSGFRWSMTQILLQKEAYGLKNPLTLMSYVTPVMAVATAILSLFMDPWNEFSKNSYFNSSWHITRSCLLMLFGGTLAFFMVLTEYILVSVTSAVTVTIAGVVKEAVTIVVAVFYFHDQFTWLKGVGLLTIMVGVSLFNWYKYDKLQKHTTSDGDMEESLTTNAAAKYVILEEMDDQDEN